jgi:hypothetical protein
MPETKLTCPQVNGTITVTVTPEFESTTVPIRERISVESREADSLETFRVMASWQPGYATFLYDSRPGHPTLPVRSAAHEVGLWSKGVACADRGGPEHATMASRLRYAVEAVFQDRMRDGEIARDGWNYPLDENGKRIATPRDRLGPDWMKERASLMRSHGNPRK